MLVFDVSSLIYIENGSNDTGWYIIPAGEDLNANDKTTIFVSLSSGEITLENGDPYTSNTDIYVHYTQNVDAVFRQAIEAVHNQQTNNQPVIIFIKHNYVFEDFVIDAQLSDDNQNPILTHLIFAPEVVISDVTSQINQSDPAQLDIILTLQNSDGTQAEWRVNGAEITNDNSTTNFAYFQIGTDGGRLTGREFVTAFETATASFAQENYGFQLAENILEYDFNEIVISATAFGARPFTNYQLEGAPEGLSISEDGVIIYNGEGFDYEATPPEGYSFTVTATAANGQTARSAIALHIQDVNDEGPDFSAETFVFSQFSDAATTAIGNLTATADTSASTLSYAITGGDGVDKFVLGGVDDGQDIVTDFSSIDRVLVQIDTPLTQQIDDLDDLLSALGLTLSGGQDKTNNGSDDTVIQQGDTILMILDGNDTNELHISQFEVEVI